MWKRVKIRAPEEIKTETDSDEEGRVVVDILGYGIVALDVK